MMIKRILRKIKVKTLVKLYPHIHPKLRWKFANKHHIKYKFEMLEKYGEKAYFDLYDMKAEIDLIDHLKVGINFSGKTVVDIGCGLRGILGVIIAEIKIGIDPSITKEVREKFNLPNDILFMCRKAENIPLDDNSVDVVSCINTLNHVENPRKVLSEIHRILKPNGLFLFEVYLEPYALGHTYEFNIDDLENEILNKFKKDSDYLIDAKKHEVTNELVNPRFGGVYRK